MGRQCLAEGSEPVWEEVKLYESIRIPLPWDS